MKREFYKTERDVTDASVRVKANLNQNIVSDKKTYKYYSMYHCQ